MSHGIKEHDTGFVKGKTWHNLDQYKQLDRAVTLDEALSVFSYESHVVKKPNYIATDTPNTEGLYQDLTPSGTQSIVRTDTLLSGQKAVVLNGAVKDRYTLVSMTEIAKLAYGQICEAYTDDLDKIEIESVGTLDNGAIQFLSIVFDSFNVHGDDSPTNNRLMVTNDYSGGGVKNLISQVRVVCKNTRGWALNKAKKSGQLHTIRHTKSVTPAVKASMINMGEICHQMMLEKKKLDQLAKGEKFNKNLQTQVLDAVFPIVKEKGSRNKAKRDEILTIFHEGQDGLSGKYAETPYAFYNAITNVLGREQGRSGTSGDWDNIAGNRAKIKEVALDKIVELVS